MTKHSCNFQHLCALELVLGSLLVPSAPLLTGVLALPPEGCGAAAAPHGGAPPARGGDGTSPAPSFPPCLPLCLLPCLFPCLPPSLGRGRSRRRPLPR